MSKPPAHLPPKDTVKLYFTLGILGSLWFAVISALFDSPAPSETQYTTIGVLAILTFFILFYFDRTSDKGLLQALKTAWPFRKSSSHED